MTLMKKYVWRNCWKSFPEVGKTFNLLWLSDVKKLLIENWAVDVELRFNQLKKILFNLKQLDKSEDDKSALIGKWILSRFSYLLYQVFCYWFAMFPIIVSMEMNCAISHHHRDGIFQWSLGVLDEKDSKATP